MILRALDGTLVERGTADVAWDIVVRPRGADSLVALEVKWLGEGWPGDVRRLASFMPDTWPANLVLVAREFSPGALEWLSTREANWADETGRARIVGPGGLVVIREVARNAVATPRSFRWSPSALSVGELLLARPRPRIAVTEIAREAGWSPARVTAVLKAFDREGWTRKQGADRGPRAWRELDDPDALLASWSAGVAASPRQQRLAHRATRDAMALLHDALVPAFADLNWAVTGWAGTETAAPFLTTIPTVHVYVSEDQFAGPVSEAIEAAGLREVEEGARVTFWAADQRVLALSTRHSDIPVVSAPRLYADLSALGGRGHDAAEHVKSELIDPPHEQARGGVDAA